VRWQVQEAKQRFSEVVRLAQAGEPQVVTKHGTAIVVVMDFEHYRQCQGGAATLMEFLRREPLVEVEVPERQRDDPRDIDLVG
jgi:prevent-host-death family protein